MRRAILQRHGRQLQVLAALAGERQADQATAVLGHEVDRFGGDVVGGEHQVAFVFPVFFVDQDHHATRGQLGHDFRDGRDGHAPIVIHEGRWRDAPTARPLAGWRSMWCVVLSSSGIDCQAFIVGWFVCAGCEKWAIEPPRKNE